VIGAYDGRSRSMLTEEADLRERSSNGYAATAARPNDMGDD